MSDATIGASSGFGPELLEPVVRGYAQETGAYASAVYLLSADAQGLQLAVLSGVSHRIASPWVRVALATATPVSDAVRAGELVWIGSQEELARRYPQLALVVPTPSPWPPHRSSPARGCGAAWCCTGPARIRPCSAHKSGRR
ncbi:hypothetical protein [Streptomyces sp. YIM S03343]